MKLKLSSKSGLAWFCRPSRRRRQLSSLLLAAGFVAIAWLCFIPPSAQAQLFAFLYPQSAQIYTHTCTVTYANDEGRWVDTTFPCYSGMQFKGIKR